MILLLGGTSETASIAEGLAAAGFRVLVSCATDVDLHTGRNPSITRRTGPLDPSGLSGLIQSEKIALLVDATHPYATQAHTSAREAAKQCSVPLVTYVRPGQRHEGEDMIVARDHDEAARLAFAYGRPVLLTTGVRNLALYAAESKRTGTPLIVRILPEVSSIDLCRAQGIPEDRIVARRGPFSVEENRQTIQRFSIGVLVTKDSGKAGGVAEKIKAARLEGCRVVLVERPAVSCAGSFRDTGTLVAHIVATYRADFR